MQDIIKLNTEVRSGCGTGQARALRRSKKIPAVIYGNNSQPISLSMCYKEFTSKYRTPGFLTNLIEVNIDNKTDFALVREIQRHPVTDMILHVDFQLVNKNTEIRADIPLLFINESNCIGIKHGGVLNILHNTLPVKCFPGSIPNNIEIDLTKLEIGHSIHINDITLPKGVKINLKEDNAPIVTISQPDSNVADKQGSDTSTSNET